MKKIFLALIFLAFIFPCSAQNSEKENNDSTLQVMVPRDVFIGDSDCSAEYTAIFFAIPTVGQKRSQFRLFTCRGFAFNGHFSVWCIRNRAVSICFCFGNR